MIHDSWNQLARESHPVNATFKKRPWIFSEMMTCELWNGWCMVQKLQISWVISSFQTHHLMRNALWVSETKLMNTTHDSRVSKFWELQRQHLNVHHPLAEWTSHRCANTQRWSHSQHTRFSQQASLISKSWTWTFEDGSLQWLFLNCCGQTFWRQSTSLSICLHHAQEGWNTPQHVAHLGCDLWWCQPSLAVVRHAMSSWVTVMWPHTKMFAPNAIGVEIRCLSDVECGPSVEIRWSHCLLVIRIYFACVDCLLVLSLSYYSGTEFRTPPKGMQRHSQAKFTNIHPKSCVIGNHLPVYDTQMSNPPNTVGKTMSLHPTFSPLLEAGAHLIKTFGHSFHFAAFLDEITYM